MAKRESEWLEYRRGCYWSLRRQARQGWMIGGVTEGKKAATPDVARLGGKPKAEQRLNLQHDENEVTLRI